MQWNGFIIGKLLELVFCKIGAPDNVGLQGLFETDVCFEYLFIFHFSFPLSDWMC